LPIKNSRPSPAGIVELASKPGKFPASWPPASAFTQLQRLDLGHLSEVKPKIDLQPNIFGRPFR
jgi:hypothetical protein